jgi:hypothetical protein
MIAFIMNIRTTWNDYFAGVSQSKTFLQQEFKACQTILNSSVLVLSCLFNNCASTSNGGAIYCSSSVNYLLVESTSFFTCSTSSNYGGAIYFYNTGSGQCVLHGVCGYDCCSTYTSSNGQFAYIYVQNIASRKNYGNYSSIVRCVNEKSNSYQTLYIYNGNICYPSDNISMNKCNGRSGLYCYPFPDSNSVTCSFSYSTFADNIATGNTCFSLNRDGAKFEFKCCNIIRNKQGSPNSEGTIYLYGNLTIKDSCILNNNATYNFYAGSTTSIFTLSNCTVDSTNHINSLVIENTITKSFIHSLEHLSTKNCRAEYEPIVNPKMFCHTCRKLRCDSFSLIYMFMFSFIHSYPQ